MRSRYNILGFVLIAAFAIFIGFSLLSDTKNNGSQPAATPPITRDGAEKSLGPP